MDGTVTIRGRILTSEDVEFVRDVVFRYWEQGRSHISRELCREWGWVQANGNLKDMACRELLLRLEAMGEVTLPPRQCTRGPGGNKVRSAGPLELSFAPRPIEGKLSELRPLEIRMVRGTKEESLFRELVDKHHYLGYRQIIGEHLKYVAFSGKRPLACIGWGGAAWKVGSRDEYIGWSVSARKRNLQLVASNTRFLILPWVRVPHLASFLLGQQARVVAKDWEQLYAHPVVLLETFVDTERFKGTCYRAANWVRVGETAGRGKYDRFNEKKKSVKGVYVYPLRRDFRRILTAEADE
jgi:hypothetical protein